MADAATVYSKWGVFDQRKKVGGIHVAPCDAEGNIYPAHELSCDCLCHPTLLPGAGGRTIIVVHGAIQ